jgi:hypothetical protein
LKYCRNAQTSKRLDAVPIIKFGGQEPVIRIVEEEQTIDLDEMEESLEPASVEIEDQTPESLMSLLDNQKLYDENPNWKDFQLPPGFAERTAQISRPEPSPPSPPPEPPLREPEPALAPPPPPPSYEAAVQPPSQQAPTAAQDLLAQSFRESMRAQAQMMERLTQEMRDMYARNASRPQYIPAPMQPQTQEQVPPAFPRYQPPPPPLPPEPPPTFLEEPIVPPLVNTGEGIPRFARDFIEDDEQAEALGLEKAVEAAKQKPSVGEFVPSLGAIAVPEALPEDLAGVKKEPVEEKKDLRQRLRDFLKRIRERLERRRSKQEPGSAQTAGTPPPKVKIPKKPRVKKDKVRPPSASRPSEESASLVNYLEELTEYLPEKRKSSFLHSDARLKIEYIKSKLQGRSGIKNQIESKFAPPVKGKVDSTVSGSSLDAGKIAETFDFMKNLASYHPDKTLGTMLQSKLNAVLHKIRE